MSAALPLGLLPTIDSPAIRQAGRDLLSLALMDARNHTLHLLAQFEAALPATPGQAQWWAGRAAWFAEAWIGRNTQRSRGTSCPSRPTRLASIEPQADRWWGTRGPLPSDPGGEATRAYLRETLEGTLELLDSTEESDDALYFYRLALCHEDLVGERLIVLAQAQGVPLPLSGPQALTPRAPLRLEGMRWQLGSAPGGFVFDNEKWAHEVALREFEIDAQPVSWAQFAEFVHDGGYDHAAFWRPEGWQWLQQQGSGEGRRAPRDVEQIGSGAVLLHRFGRQVYVPVNQPVQHVSWWEADAWCRWAGRRLPDEAEWEAAAQLAARRGFAWGDVQEWTASWLRPFPGFTPDPWCEYSQPHFGQTRVRRGASFATRQRMKHPKFRGFAPPAEDAAFVGFRSCAL